MRASHLIAPVLVALGAATATVHSATPSARNGEIAFVRFRFVNSPLRRELWVVRSDGAGVRRVTRVKPNYLDSMPDWSSSGSRILFQRCGPITSSSDGRCDVWSTTLSGRATELSPSCHAQVSPACPDDESPAYSPDGRQIVFVRYSGTSPRLVVADTQLHDARVIFGDARRGSPDIAGCAWSPDSRRIAFAVDNDGAARYKPVGGRAIFVINVDGTGLRRLTPWSLKAGADDDRVGWSPDGSRILFRTITSEGTGPGPPGGDIYTIAADGTELRRLTRLPFGAGVQLGSFSPDGRAIVYSTTAGATSAGGQLPWPDVFTMTSDGAHVRPLTHTRNWEGSADWRAAR